MLAVVACQTPREEVVVESGESALNTAVACLEAKAQYDELTDAPPALKTIVEDWARDVRNDPEAGAYGLSPNVKLEGIIRTAKPANGQRTTILQAHYVNRNTAYAYHLRWVLFVTESGVRSFKARYAAPVGTSHILNLTTSAHTEGSSMEPDVHVLALVSHDGRLIATTTGRLDNLRRIGDDTLLAVGQYSQRASYALVFRPDGIVNASGQVSADERACTGPSF